MQSLIFYLRRNVLACSRPLDPFTNLTNPSIFIGFISLSQALMILLGHVWYLLPTANMIEVPMVEKRSVYIVLGLGHECVLLSDSCEGGLLLILSFNGD